MGMGIESNPHRSLPSDVADDDDDHIDVNTKGRSQKFDVSLS